MERYIKITSIVGGSCNANLKTAIIYIGEHKAIIKEWREDHIEEHYASLKKLSEEERKKKRKAYFKFGIRIIAKGLGRLRNRAVRCMVKPEIIKGYKRWHYNEQTYAKAFKYVIDLLELFKNKCPPNDRDYLINLIDGLYQQINNNPALAGEELERVYSNAFLFWQKDMLNFCRNYPTSPEKDKKSAGKILRELNDVDKPLPQ